MSQPGSDDDTPLRIRSGSLGHGPPIPPHLDALITLLSDDDRPSLLLDLTHSNQIVFRNDALSELVLAHGGQSPLDQWIARLATDKVDPKPGSPVREVEKYAGRNWRRKVVGPDAWTVVYSTDKGMPSAGQEPTTTTPSASLPEQCTEGLFLRETPLHSRLVYSGDKLSEWFVDWVRSPCIPPNNWARLVKEHAWETTALGPMHKWPHDLCQCTHSIMACPDARMIVWGDDLLVVFNEAAQHIIGDNAIDHLGRPLCNIPGQSMINQHYINSIRTVLQNGKTDKQLDVEYNVQGPSGVQTFWDMQILPLMSEQGSCAGALIMASGCTSRVLQKRRKKLAAEIVKHVARANDLTTFWDSLLQVLDDHSQSVGYALLYAPRDGSADQKAGVSSRYELIWTVRANSSAFPDVVDISQSSDSLDLATALNRASTLRQVVVLQQNDGTIPPELAVSVPQCGILVKTVCIMPIREEGKQPLGTIIWGLNPKTDYEPVDQVFMEWLGSLIARAAAAVTHTKGENRNHVFSELNRSLEQNLGSLDPDTKKSEEVFASLVRKAPLGM